MKNRPLSFLLALLLALIPPCSTALASTEETTLTPGTDESYVSQIVDILSGGDGLYRSGINGFDIYDYLGYVYMGWRTTGGLWQNHVIESFIMEELENAGYQTGNEEVEAPYGSKPASDKSSAVDGDYAWLIKYQETEDKKLGTTWDPEFSSLEIKMVTESGEEVPDPAVQELADSIGGTWWAYNPMTEVYQKHFADEFFMDYENDIASLENVNEKIRAMHSVLMSSNLDRDSRTSVDDYLYIARESIDKLNKEAGLNKRTRLAWESDFTDPSGTDPSTAQGLEGELIYVGEVDSWENTNSEGIPAEQIRGCILLTDSALREGYLYAYQNGAAGVASTASLEPYLHPKDDEGNILEPWYDSSRYEKGIGMSKRKAYGVPEDVRIIEWQFSRKQYDNARRLLARAKEEGCKVMARQIVIGQTYPMTKTEGSPGEGQTIAIAEIKGSLHPEKRVLICAHVQEPGCNDNATGVASLLGTAAQYKKLIDEGKIPRPACTITFMWGDEMNMGEFWMDGHPGEVPGLIGALDMDMTGEDPVKTGGVMRIEKTPDPSASYNYTLDGVPWNDPDSEIASLSNPAYDKDYQDRQGEFVRLPDSHTLWGSEDVYGLFSAGWYLNDLYRYVASTVIDRHDDTFRLEVCPYEGGSDHETFLESNIPALLTWHFTDYVYHTSSDTLYMASPREMENVSIVTLTTALMMSDLCTNEPAAMDLVGAVKEASMNRMDAEKINTDHHLIYVKAGHAAKEDALENEKEVLNAWGKWYTEALESVASLVDEPSDALLTAIDTAKSDLAARTAKSLAYAEQVLDPKPQPPKPVDISKSKVVLSKTAFTYNGKVQKPKVQTIGGKKLTLGKDYTLKWSNPSSRRVGKYTLTITGKGNYTGSVKASYKINPIGTIIKKLQRSGKTMKATWEKQATTMSAKRITGYQLQLATDRNFKNNKKTLTIKGYKTTSKKVTGLKSGRKYYVRIRTYKIVNETRFYSTWSKTKTV